MWSEASAKIIKDQFICVAVNSHVAMSRKDAEGEFIRDTCGLKLPGAGGIVQLLTASGKQLGNVYVAGTPEETMSSLRKALANFNKLPEKDRKPLDGQIGDIGRVDPNVVKLAPPAGAMIVRVHYRTLTRDKENNLRHANAKDFPNPHVHVPYVSHYGEAFEAQPDFMWLPEAEWKSLVPAKPKVGEGINVAAAVQSRMARFHLDPAMSLGESLGWNPKSIRAREMTLSIEKVGAQSVHMRLEGQALLGVDYATSERTHAIGYEPRLLGYLDYDFVKKAFTRFDVVALGDFYGKLGGDNAAYWRPGRHPLGVAFELVSGKTPSERIPPRAALVYHTLNPDYLGK